jgi:ribonucleoside-triphosphate reductase
MREKIADFQQETGNIFNLEATPAEGASYRLARVDKTEYPDIRTFNQEFYGNGGRGIEPYYTNSTQLPVGYTTDVFEALDLQDSLQTKYTGGTVLHIFLGEEEPSPTATKKLIRKIAENYSLPYYTITPTFSVCPDHGYIAGEHQICPTCKANNKTTECEVYSRVVGYLRPVNQWNRGKQQEFSDRKTFDMMQKIMVAK